MNQQHGTYQHYELLRREDGTLHELGRGAMGITYKAFDTNLRSHVALKVINAAYLHSETARVRFLREARAAAALRHRNVASVHHLCGDGDTFFYAMEFIDGETVEAWVRRAGKLPPETALRITLQVVRALGAAAKQRLVHRDIKPANLMIVHEDDDEHFLVKLIDFGLARPLFGRESSAAAGQPATATVGGFVGTPLFASPEQLQEMEIDSRSDIYSLGVTLWFLLAGRPPFTGTLSILFQQHVTLEPPWEQLAGTPEPVLALLSRMLQKRPEQRPQNPGELRDEIVACLRALLVSTGDAGTLDAEDAALFALSGQSGAGSRDAGTPSSPAIAVVAASLPAAAPGLLLAERFRLGRLVGEGSSGRVFQANDLRRAGRVVAVRVFHPELLAEGADFEWLAERVARVQAAPHPNLLELAALERYRHHAYLVTEWVEGLTLTGLLRKRGTLTPAEALRVLKGAAAAADHARARALPALELALHQILLGFPGGAPRSHPADDLDGPAILRAPLTDWPELTLKIDALGATREAGALATWTGGVTMVPNAPWPPLTGRSGEREDSLRLRALGSLVHGLLSGAPVPPALLGGECEVSPVARVRPDGETRPLTLPLLGEAGNTALRLAFAPKPAYASGQEFFCALARATGFDPENLRPAGENFRAPERIPAPVPGHSRLEPAPAPGERSLAPHVPASVTDATPGARLEAGSNAETTGRASARWRVQFAEVSQRVRRAAVLPPSLQKRPRLTSGLALAAGMALTLLLAWSLLPAAGTGPTLAATAHGEPSAVSGGVTGEGPAANLAPSQASGPAFPEPPPSPAASEESAPSLPPGLASAAPSPVPVNPELVGSGLTEVPAVSSDRRESPGPLTPSIDQTSPDPGGSPSAAASFPESTPPPLAQPENTLVPAAFSPAATAAGQQGNSSSSTAISSIAPDGAEAGATPERSLVSNKRISSKSRSVRDSGGNSRRRQATPRPDFWQRLFGIEPKPKRKSDRR